MEIYKILETKMINEIDNMPYNLSRRQLMRLAAKAVKKVGSQVAKKYGIENPNLQALVDMFFFTNYGFPSFSNEAYIGLLKGQKGVILRIGEIDENGNFVMYNKKKKSNGK